MSDVRIKNMADISPADTTLVAGDSTGTGTGKATIRVWVLAGLAWALSQLANAAIAAQGVWTFANNVVLSQGLTVAGLITASFGVDFGSHKATSMLDPTTAQDGATKAYVDKPGVVTVSALLTTADATPTTILTVTPTDNAITRYRVSAMCGKASLNEYGGYEAIIVVSKSGGTPTVGSAFGHATGRTAGISASDISAAASGANVAFQVTGTAATTLKWLLWIESVTVTP